MFVCILHHKPKSLTDVKSKLTLNSIGLKYEEKVNFLLCMVRYTRIMNSKKYIIYIRI